MPKKRENKIIGFHILADGTMLTDKEFREDYHFKIENNKEFLESITTLRANIDLGIARHNTYEVVKERHERVQAEIDLAISKL